MVRNPKERKQNGDVKMYRCDKCKNTFNEPKSEKFDYGWDWVCPICGSSIYHKFTYCANCGAEIDEEQAAFDLCSECESAIKAKVLHAFDGYKKNEIQYIRWMLEDWYETSCRQ